MLSRNLELASVLERLGQLLELDGADRFRTRAYGKAARSVRAASYDIVETVLNGGDPTELAGVGPRLAGLIGEFARTGRVARFQELEAKYPPGLLELMRIPRLDVCRIRLLHERLGVGDLEDLRRAAEAGRLAALKGIGPRVQAEVLHCLESLGSDIPYRRADLIDDIPGLLDSVGSFAGVERVLLAGSLRRCREVVSEVDLVLVMKRGRTLAEPLSHLASWAVVLDHEDGRAALRLASGLRVNLFAAEVEAEGATLLLRTGAPSHVDALKARALERGVDLAGQGLDEGQIYKSLGLPFIEPELREGRGEIEAAARGALPRLIRLEDIKGDLHSHTDATDGRETLERMAEAAAERGLRYLAVTDHTKSLKITNGQDERRLAAQMDRIDRLNGKLKGLTLLKAAEVDILEDGKLDLSDAILKELDLTVCSVHSKFTLPPDVQTDRVLRALEHPSFRILGHPTGRLLLRRRGHPLDIDRVIRAAKDLGRILELNAQPDRLDLDDVACRRAKDAGVRLAISSDSHSIHELDHLRFGIDQARRGWLEPQDVVNTLDLPDLLKLLRSA